MGIWDDIDKIKVGRSGNRLEPGDYVVQVLEVREHKGGPPKYGEYVIIEFRVVQSTNPSIRENYIASDVIRMDGNFPDMAKADAKAFIMAAMGLDPTDDAAQAQVKTAFVQSIFGPNNPLAGNLVQCRVAWKTPKNNPNAKPFPRYEYRPCLDDSGKVRALPLPPKATTAHVSNESLEALRHSNGNGNGHALPPAPPPPPVVSAPPFPPAGWFAHASTPGMYHNGKEWKSEAELRQIWVAGKA